jgi:rod shape-determining protein MreC
MEYTPPPFFKQGPSALARLVAFALISISLLVFDARFKLLERVRYGFALVLYPLQVAARAPGDAASNLGSYLSRQQNLLSENTRLEREKLEAAKILLRTRQLEDENSHLRALMEMRERLPVVSVAGEMLYDTRDPFTRKVVIDKGTMHHVHAGQVVIDAAGVMGQVTRAFPLVSEVSLVTDRDQAIPVQVRRNGLRAIAYGTPGGADGGMELKFLATNADVKEGDELVTSGIDGVYLSGLPVAKVLRIEREAGYAFAKIICKPAAGVERFGQVLVLTQVQAARPEAPPPETEEKPVKGKRKRLRPESGDKEIGSHPAPAPAPAPAAAPPATPAAKK